MLAAMDFMLHTEFIVADGQDGVKYSAPKSKDKPHGVTKSKAKPHVIA